MHLLCGASAVLALFFYATALGSEETPSLSTNLTERASSKHRSVTSYNDDADSEQNHYEPLVRRQRPPHVAPPVAVPVHEPATTQARAQQQYPAPPQHNYGRAMQAMLGSACSSGEDCAGIKNAKCRGGACACSSATVSFSNIACVPRAQAFGDPCVVTAQCKDLDPLASCNLDRCMCETVYHVAGRGCEASSDYGSSDAAGLQCLKKLKLDKDCCDDRQCSYSVWDSKCDDTTKKCKCKRGFINIGNHMCAPLANALGESCSVTPQCQKLGAGVVCNEEGKCVCDKQKRYMTNVPGAPPPAAVDRRRRAAVAALTPACVKQLSFTSNTFTVEACCCATTAAKFPQLLTIDATTVPPGATVVFTTNPATPAGALMIGMDGTVTIDSRLLTFPAGVSSMTIRVTATSSTSSMVIATANLVIQQDCCCTQAPMLLQNRRGVFLYKTLPALTPDGRFDACAAGTNLIEFGDMVSSGTAGPGVAKVYMSDLFTMPCGGRVDVVSVMLLPAITRQCAALSYNPDQKAVEIRAGVPGFRDVLGAAPLTPDVFSCSMSITVRSCNGMTITVGFTLDIIALCNEP